jgi:hypothetical protein
MYARSDLCKIGPRPRATKTDKTKEPETLPATVKIATVRPQAMARAITNKTLGPGAKIIIIAATMYSANREGITIGQILVITP